MAMSSQQSAVAEGANVYERSLLADEAFAPKQYGDAVGCIPAATRSLRVLVADDNLDVADGISMLVRKLGHEVQRTYDYDETAILKVISSYRPDVVLLDIAMPEMEGCLLARQIREQARFKGILLIALTECAGKALRLLCAEAGFDHILVKPIEPSALKELMLLQQHRLAEPTEAPRASPRKYGILIVDDDGGVRDVLSMQMRREGFDVWLATGGHEAVELYRRHRDSIDVVVLDVLMPGLDGPHTLTALQKLNPRIASCFMSGSLGDYTEGELRNLGAAAFFLKPFRLAEVTHAIRDLASKTNSNGVPAGERNGSVRSDSRHVLLCQGK